jgi:hypothetical protein
MALKTGVDATGDSVRTGRGVMPRGVFPQGTPERREQSCGQVAHSADVVVPPLTLYFYEASARWRR